MEIPDFLIEMSKTLNTQDNRITSDPMFCVYYDEKVPTSSDYSDGFEYAHHDGDYTVIGDNDEALIEWFIDRSLGDGCSFLKDYVDHVACEDEYDSAIEYFKKNYDPECDGFPEDIGKFHYINKKHFVKGALTEKSAQQFIDRKQHDFAKLYIYVESMYHCYEMIELRNWLKNLTTQEVI